MNLKHNMLPKDYRDSDEYEADYKIRKRFIRDLYNRLLRQSTKENNTFFFDIIEKEFSGLDSKLNTWSEQLLEGIIPEDE